MNLAALLMVHAALNNLCVFFLFSIPFEVWEWSWSAGWVAKRVLVFLSNAWVNMIWLTSPQPSFSLFQLLVSSAAPPTRTELWILAKGVTNKPQRGEVKWEVSLVRNSDLLTTVHGSYCGIMLPGTFVGLSLMMPSWSSISFASWCCHP